MSADGLYNLLAGEQQSCPIPWDKAAQGFIMVKVASGGLFPEELDELEKVAVQIAISPEEAYQAYKGGILSGIRSSGSGDIRHASNIRRKRGERAGKTLGSAGGALLGSLLARKGGTAARVGGAAVGGVLGYTGGKAVGEEADRQRIKARLRAKRASMEKTTGFEKDAAMDEERKRRIRRVLGAAGLGAAIGAGISGRNVQRVRKLVAGSEQIKVLRDAAKKGFIDNKKVQQATSNLVRDQLRGTSPAGHIAGGVGKGGLMGATAGRIYHDVREPTKPGPKVKTAQEPEMLSVPIQEGRMNEPTPEVIEQFLQAQQEANELEFFRQKAEEAEMAAQAAEERAQMLEQQMMQTQEQQSQVEQEGAMREEMAHQQADMAGQQAQMAQQDAVQARDESLQAQQNNIALRQAVTNYRQALMDLLSQDPTQAVPPAPVPTGPPPAPGPAGPPPGGGAAPPEGEAPPAESGPQAGGKPPGPPPPGGGPAAAPPKPPAPTPPAA